MQKFGAVKSRIADIRVVADYLDQGEGALQPPHLDPILYFKDKVLRWPIELAAQTCH